MLIERLKWWKGLALAITLVGFALRLYTLGSESLWYDELLQVNLALDRVPSMLYRLYAHSAVPLDYLITHYWIILGKQDAWVRLPAVIWGTLSLPLAFQLGRRLLDERAGLLFMLLLTCSPFHVRYSQEARPYALGLLGVLALVYALWRIRATGRWRYALPLAPAALVVSLSHLFANFVFIPLAAFLGIDLLAGPARRRRLKGLLALGAAGLVAFSVLLSLGWGGTFFRASTRFGEAVVEPARFTISEEEGDSIGDAPQVTPTFVADSILGYLGAGSTAWSLWWFNSLAGLGVLGLLGQRRFRLVLLLLLWLVAPVVIVLVLLVHRDAFFAPRYIFFILPAYLLALTAGLMTVTSLLRRVGPAWAAAGLLLLGGLLLTDMGIDLERLYHRQDKEDWHLVGEFIRQNAGPDDAVLAIKAEPTMNWYYPPATADGNAYSRLETIQAAVAQAERSWVILSIYSSGIDARIKAWLSDAEQGAIQFGLDPVITVYYLGHKVDKEQLLTEVQGFVLPADHALYASLARENRRRPEIARRYYELAITHAPDEATRQTYRTALEALR